MSPIPPAIVAGLVWKPLALALLAALFSLALRSRAMRHAIWFCVLIGMMTLPVLSLITPPLHLFSRPAPIVAAGRRKRSGSPEQGRTRAARTDSA